MFLKEGGAGGHMQHPFDLSDVKNGEDLRDFFEKAGEVVKKSQAVKIDGVNVSFKLISDEKGRKEFAVDRGSTKPIDIEGVSIDRVSERFPKVGHGMRGAIKTLLTIFNEALPKIEPELKKLGMWDNPAVFLNTEYVAGTTNVTEYDHNFLAIHGVNQFYEKTNSRTGVERRGLERPTIWDPDKEKEVPIKDPSVEIAYDPEALQKLTDKVEPFAKKYDFEIYTTVPTSFKEEAEINFSDTLKEPFTVVFSEEDEVTQSLEDWLKEVDNPRHKFIKKIDGKKIGALSKEVYTNILGGKAITSFVSEEEDVKPAIAGAVFYHATRMLGNDILRALTSPMGDVTDHEGVVIRHKNFGQKPVKITGEFILGGMRTSFQESKEYSEDFINEVLDTFLENLGQKVEDNGTPDVIYLPGGFKPPHKGHLSMVLSAAEKYPDVPIRIVSGKGKEGEGRGGITLEMASKIWDIYLNELKRRGIDVELIKINEDILRTDAQGNPLTKMNKKTKKREPSTSTNPWDWIKKKIADNPDIEKHIAIVYSEKDKNYDVLADATLGGFENLTVTPIEVKACHDDDLSCPLSATNFREAVQYGDFENFNKFLPSFVNDDQAENIWTFLGGAPEALDQDYQVPPEWGDSEEPLYETIFGLVEEVLNEIYTKKNCEKKDGSDGGCEVTFGDEHTACYNNCGVAKMATSGKLQKEGEEELEETSSSGGGSVAGAPGETAFDRDDKEKVKGSIPGIKITYRRQNAN